MAKLTSHEAARLPDLERFNIIYADPPWSYRDKAVAGNRGVEFKYGVMTLAEIGALPVQDLAAANCALFLWATFPQLPDCLKVLEAWGFKYKTAAFTWAKTNSKKGSFSIGMGHYTRSNAEVCLLGLRGRLERRSGGVRSLVVAPRARHSEKPAEVREHIVELFGDLPRIELFARTRAAGWAAWGNQVESDVRLEDGRFVSGGDAGAGTRKETREG